MAKYSGPTNWTSGRGVFSLFYKDMLQYPTVARPSPSPCKSQSAMEYLMTYGWAILIVAVVLAALYQLGFFSGTNFITTSCIAESGFTCQKPVMNVTGYVQVDIGQISNGTMTVTGYACTNNTQSPSSFNTYSGTMALVSGQVQQAVVKCPGVGGQVGSAFRGYIWIQYTFAGQSGLVTQIAVLSAVASTPAAFAAPPPDIYCVGTYDASPYTQTYYAPVSSTGIGTLTYGGAYPVGIFEAGCSISGGDIYCVGTTGASPYTQTYYAPISSTGIGTWTYGGAYPVAMYYAGCSISGAGGAGFFGG